MRDRHARLIVKPLTIITWVNCFIITNIRKTQCKTNRTNGLQNVKMPFIENRIVITKKIRVIPFALRQTSRDLQIVITKKIRVIPFHITQNMTSQWLYKKYFSDFTAKKRRFSVEKAAVLNTKSGDREGKRRRISIQEAAFYNI